MRSAVIEFPAHRSRSAGESLAWYVPPAPQQRPSRAAGPRRGHGHAGAHQEPAAIARHRLAVLVLAAIVVGLLGTALAAAHAGSTLRSVPASAPERAPAATVAPAAGSGAPAEVDAASVIVGPGDTLWSVARRIQPTGDVRALVRKLRIRNGTSVLQVGQRLVVP